jgi:hypothetical protein
MLRYKIHNFRKANIKEIGKLTSTFKTQYSTLDILKIMNIE